MKETLTLTKEELDGLIASGIREYEKQNGKSEKPMSKRGYREAPEFTVEHISKVKAVASLSPYRAVVVLGPSGWRIFRMESYQRNVEHGKWLDAHNKENKRGIYTPDFHAKDK